MTQEHTLKTIDRYFDAVERGEKTFEVRVNDRAFQKGDTLKLERWDAGKYGPEITIPRKVLTKRVTYLLQGGQFGIEPGYCILGLGEVEK